MCSMLPEPVESGMTAVPCRSLLLCISNLWASGQNPLVLSVTVICVCMCIQEIFSPLLGCSIDSIDMLVSFFFSPHILKEQWIRVMINGYFFPSCICATEVVVSHLWLTHLELTLSAETFGEHKQCWKLLGESLFVLLYRILWMLHLTKKRRGQVFEIESYL